MAITGRRCIWNVASLVRTYYTTPAQKLQETLAKPLETAYFTCFRTQQSDPGKHEAEQVGLYYTIPPNEAHIFQHGGLPKPFMQQCQTFNETSLMIRKPALEVIKHMKGLDTQNVMTKYVLFGKPGAGKSLCLSHIIHHAYVCKWVLIHVPWVGTWLRSPKEVVNSLTRPGFVDLPENAVKWLLHFKTQNQTLIKELDLRLGKDYEWSKREFSKIGEPLLNIVELGLNRSRHASEIIIALVDEIKTLCKSNKCKVLLAIDGINAFYHSETRVKNEERILMPPEKVSLVKPFFEAAQADWHNCAGVFICDQIATPGHDASPLPLYQLGEKGFHHLHPFIPVHVPEMTEAEVRSVLAYYKERRWLQTTNADNEIIFLCGGNPYKLMNLCNPL